AVQPVEAQYAPGFGILKRNPDGEIVSFTEKPPADRLSGLESLPGSSRPFMASMGIYVFSTDMLRQLLEEPGDDFGHDIVPRSIDKRRVMGYIFDGYWADIGTIRRFYEINIEMSAPRGPFELYNPNWPIYTRPRFLPPSEVHASRLDQVLLADGCHIYESDIANSVIGLRSIIGPNATIRSSVIMGADYYETKAEKAYNRRIG